MMKHLNSRLFVVIGITVGLLTSSGCIRRPPPIDTVPVKGKITFDDGLPADGVTVAFLSKIEAGGAANAVTNSEGEFSLITWAGPVPVPGARVGEYNVVIVKYEGGGDPPMEEWGGMGDKMMGMMNQGNPGMEKLAKNLTKAFGDDMTAGKEKLDEMFKSGAKNSKGRMVSPQQMMTEKLGSVDKKEKDGDKGAGGMGPGLEAGMMGGGMGGGQATLITNDRYADPTTSGLAASVEDTDENYFEFEIER